MKKMFLKIFLALSILSSVSQGYSQDLSTQFEEKYRSNLGLSDEDKLKLNHFDFYLIPGILAESFTDKDGRATFNFAFLTRDYFFSQYSMLKDHQFVTERIQTSSHSIEETRLNIRKALRKTQETGRKAFLISHSLGGLALLEELISNEALQDSVGGIIFFQSPFYGTPVADLFLENPYYIYKALSPFLPFLNTSEETIRYLSTSERSRFMKNNHENILGLMRKIPVLTVSGDASKTNSLFQPAINLIEFGCTERRFSRCLSPKLFAGPYEKSDGMVPLTSSLLQKGNFVILKKTDHGETVVRIPFETYKKKRTLESLLKLFLNPEPQP